MPPQVPIVCDVRYILVLQIYRYWSYISGHGHHCHDSETGEDVRDYYPIIHLRVYDLHLPTTSTFALKTCKSPTRKGGGHWKKHCVKVRVRLREGERGRIISILKSLKR